MEIAMSLLLMLGGVAVFMYGMRLMSQGIEQSAGPGVRRLFQKIDKNPMLNYSVGLLTTAAVQSSSTTSIMTVGLASAGVVNEKQGAGIVLGAKVGTTLGAFLMALSGVGKGAFSISAMFAAVAFVGVIIIFTTDKDSLNKIGLLLTGFGMLFIGLEVMEYAIGGGDSILSTELSGLFQYDVMQNPILLLLLGCAFTLVIQSSTAATGVFLTFLATGVIQSLDQSFFLLMGANIGTCSDGLMASLSANARGKRIAVFHVLSSTIGAVSFSAILLLLRAPIVDFFENLFVDDPQWSLATFNLIYNAIYTLVLLVFLNPLVDFVTKLVKEKQPKAGKVFFIDDRLLASPSIAIAQALKEVSNMAVLARENLDMAFKALLLEDMGGSKKIDEKEAQIDAITRALASFFIKISATPISVQDKKLVGGLHHVINDIERLGDYAVLLFQDAGDMQQYGAHFPQETREELQGIWDKIAVMYDLSLDAFKTRRTDNFRRMASVHTDITDWIGAAREAHISRLSGGVYSVEVSKSLYSVLFSLQRVADHLENIGFSIRSDTGSQKEAFKSIEAGKRR